MTIKHQHLFPITIFLLLASLRLLFLMILGGIFEFTPSSAALFCEAESPGLIKERSNTWSNLAFCIVALMVSYTLSYRQTAHQNLFSTSVFYPLLFCFGISLLGPGSMALHATVSPLGGRLDVLAMFLVSSFMFCYSLQRLFNFDKLTFSIFYTLCMILSVLSFSYHGKIAFNLGAVDLTFGLFAVGSGIMELYLMFFKLDIRKRYGISYMLLFLLAFIIWQVDHRFCNPEQIIQFHAIWHILDACSVYYIFKYYYSQKTMKIQQPN